MSEKSHALAMRLQEIAYIIQQENIELEWLTATAAECRLNISPKDFRRLFDRGNVTIEKSANVDSWDLVGERAGIKFRTYHYAPYRGGSTTPCMCRMNEVDNILQEKATAGVCQVG